MGALIKGVSPPYLSGRVVMTTDTATAGGEDSTVTFPHNYNAKQTSDIHCFAQVGIDVTPDSVYVYAYATDTASITITAKTSAYADDTVGINWFATW